VKLITEIDDDELDRLMSDLEKFVDEQIEELKEKSQKLFGDWVKIEDDLPIKGKIERWINQQKPNSQFRADTVHWNLFKYTVSRSTINKHLRDFAASGLIKKVSNQVWVIK